MGLMNSSYGFPVHMQFAPPPGVAQMDPSAFITPQEKAAAEKAQRGDLTNQVMSSLTGQGAIHPDTPVGSGLPGPMADFGGSFLQNSGGAASAAPAQGAAVATSGAAGGGMMASIMKLLPMLIGG